MQNNQTNNTEVLTFFNGWQIVTPEQAKAWVLHKWNGIQTMTEQEKEKYINKQLHNYTVAQAFTK